MKKELITVENLDSCISGDGRLYVCRNRILTPGAKDELARRGTTVVYGEEPAPEPRTGGACRSCGAGKTFFVGPEEGAGLGSAGSLESLSMAVAAMLRTQYGVTDPGDVRRLTVEALKTIRDNVQPGA